MLIPKRFEKLLARKDKIMKELREETSKRHKISWFFLGAEIESTLMIPSSEEEALGHLPEELRFAVWLFVMYRLYPDNEGNLNKSEDDWESEYDELPLVDELADLAVESSPSWEQAKKTLAYLGLPEENIQLFLQETKA